MVKDAFEEAIEKASAQEIVPIARPVKKKSSDYNSSTSIIRLYRDTIAYLDVVKKKHSFSSRDEVIQYLLSNQKES